eukprot:1195176-Prorocentrum_minimum.AAC.1
MDTLGRMIPSCAAFSAAARAWCGSTMPSLNRTSTCRPSAPAPSAPVWAATAACSARNSCSLCKVNEQGGEVNEQGGEGGEVNEQGGEVNEQGGEVNEQGGEVNAQGGEMNAQGGEVNAQGGEVNEQGGEVNEQGGEVNTQGGEVNTRGGEVNEQGGEVNAQQQLLALQRGAPRGVCFARKGGAQACGGVKNNGVLQLSTYPQDRGSEVGSPVHPCHAIHLLSNYLRRLTGGGNLHSHLRGELQHAHLGTGHPGFHHHDGALDKGAHHIKVHLRQRPAPVQ